MTGLNLTLKLLVHQPEESNQVQPSHSHTHLLRWPFRLVFALVLSSWRSDPGGPHGKKAGVEVHLAPVPWLNQGMQIDLKMLGWGLERWLSL